MISLNDSEERQFYSGRTGTGGPLDVAVGLDSDSAITASTNKNDFSNINTGSSYLHNASVTGVGGGVSKIGGMGAMIVKVKVTRPNGSKQVGYLCDPNAAWLRKQSRDEGTVRIFSTTMLKKMGVIFRMEEYNDLDMVVCKRSGNMIETTINHGIVVIDTDSEFDARNFRKNRSVRNLIDRIQMKEASPLFFMDDDNKVISLSMDFNCGAGCGTSEQGLQGAFDQAKPAIATVTLPNEDWQADVASYEEGEKVLSFVMNESALTQDAKAWLWHHRFGHLNFADAAKLGLGFTKAPNCDCAICDQKGFKRAPFHRKPESLAYVTPPYHKVSLDGFGGQKSYGCKSYGGAVGGFVFACAGTGAIDVKLYADRAQFPRLFKQYLHEVMARDYMIRMVCCDCDPALISVSEMEPIFAEYGIIWSLSSPGSPQENGFAENAVNRVKETSRAMMLSAPHLNPNCWGAALKYACAVLFIKPLKANNDKSPYECVNGRAPPRRNMSFRVFGAPCQYKPLESPKHVNDPRTVDGYYLGKEGHFSSAILVYCLERKKIFRVSPRKVRVHELAYTKQITREAIKGKEITAIIGDEDATSADDQPLPTLVLSAKGLHEAEERVAYE